MSAKHALLLLFIPAAGVAAPPAADEMARCAGIAAPDTRLACYDALAHRLAEKTSAAAVAAAPKPVQSQGSASAPNAAQATTNSVPAGTSAPVAAATAGAESATQFAADPKNFGLTPAQQHTGGVGPTRISAHIDNVSAGLSGQTTIVLDSGQTWTVLDNDGRLAPGDAVTIKKAALGAFLMMTPSHHSYRVSRIR